jgi:hypothetical protein
MQLRSPAYQMQLRPPANLKGHYRFANLKSQDFLLRFQFFYCSWWGLPADQSVKSLSLHKEVQDRNLIPMLKWESVLH